MRPRNPWAVGLFLLGAIVLAGAPAAYARELTVDDVLRLHAAGVNEDIILSEIIVTETVFRLDVDEILRLHEAGVPERVVQFMVDTGRAGTAAEEAAPGEAETEPAESDDEVALTEDEDDDDYYDYDTRVLVGLRWGYPAWWYDTYWWDYWYYDCHYDPWYVSWSHPCGSWYPTWYYPTACWVSPGWGYRYDWWGTSYRVHWDDFDHHRGWAGTGGGLSDWKYKSGGGSGSPALLAGGLKTRDATRLEPPKRSRATAVAADDVRRPASGVRKPAPAIHGAKQPDLKRPTRPVRKPAAVDEPVKKTVRRQAQSPEVGDRKPVKPTDRPSRVDRRAPASEPRKDPAVKVKPQAMKPQDKPQAEKPKPESGKAPPVERSRVQQDSGRSAPEPRSAPPPAPRDQGKSGGSGGHSSRGGKGR